MYVTSLVRAALVHCDEFAVKTSLLREKVNSSRVHRSSASVRKCPQVSEEPYDGTAPHGLMRTVAEKITQLSAICKTCSIPADCSFRNRTVPRTI